MPDEIVEQNEESEGKLDRFKAHIKRNQVKYAFGAGIVVTVGIYVVTKRVTVRYMPVRIEGTNLLMNRVLFKKSAMYHITNVFGAPVNRLSIVVKCVETGVEKNSLAAMAREMGISKSALSQHLNFPDMHPSVQGYHFKKLGYAVYNHGNWDLLSK
jgi:hypothetical protein